MLLTNIILAQSSGVPVHIGNLEKLQYVSPISSRSSLRPAETKALEMKDGRARVSRNIIVPGKDAQKLDDYFIRHRNVMFQRNKVRNPSLVFDAYTSDSKPTDPSLAVGPNHVFVVYNTGFRIFDKKGHPLTDALYPSPAIFPKDGCCDLTVSYDNAADRWVLSFLSGGEEKSIKSFAQIAISDGSDPVNCGWYVYEILAIEDYQKLSIWSDGYYITENTSGMSKVWVLDRDRMLQGVDKPQIIGFDLPYLTRTAFYSPQVLNVIDGNMPARGNAPIVYMQDDAWSGVEKDHVKLWFCNIDWDQPSKSRISMPQEIDLKPFISVFDQGAFKNLSQPSKWGDLDALQSIIMNQAQFRKFKDHNSAIFHFVVDTDASYQGELAGIRWIELRQDSDKSPWYLYQEGTYTAPDGRHAWCGSMSMDGTGNIALGYTSMSGTNSSEVIYPSSYFTGRYAKDPLGTMTLGEKLIAQGTEGILGNRYGDYCKMDVDPVDDASFYFINEYVKGAKKGVVGKFKLEPNLYKDVGVVEIISPTNGLLSGNQTIKVKLFNYGKSDVSNFEISYQIDTTMVTEHFTDTIPSLSSIDYNFNTKANLSVIGKTYTITSYTTLTGDEDLDNDKVTKQVRYTYPNDIGVSEIVYPVSGNGLTKFEEVVVMVTNYGHSPQNSFLVNYTVDGKVEEELCSTKLPALKSMFYTFKKPIDLSQVGDYTITASTNLTSDSNPANDSCEVTITNAVCQPKSKCTSGDGIYEFYLQGIASISDCDDDGYSNYTGQSTTLYTGGNYKLVVSAHYGDQYLKVWIDYNDNFVFEDNEIIASGLIPLKAAPNQYTLEVDLSLDENLPPGEHLLRAKTVWKDDLFEACSANRYGETEDYKVTLIKSAVGIEDQIIENAPFIVRDFNDRTFELEMTPSVDYDGLINVTVYDTRGVRYVYHNLKKEDAKYTYPLNMNYVSPGVYLIRMGTTRFGKIKKIIVK